MGKERQLKSGGFGTASLILGIIGIFLFPFLFSTLAIIFGAIAIGRNEKYAKIGLGLGIMGWVLMVVMFFLALSFISSMIGGVFGLDQEDDVLTVETPKQTVLQKQQLVKETLKIRKGTLVIDKVATSNSVLSPIRVTINNTGEVSFIPKFDIYAIDKAGQIVCEDKPYFGIGLLKPGETKTDELQIACMLKKDGEYNIKVDMLDNDYQKISSAQKSVVVAYWDLSNYGFN